MLGILSLFLVNIYAFPFIIFLQDLVKTQRRDPVSLLETHKSRKYYIIIRKYVWIQDTKMM